MSAAYLSRCPVCARVKRVDDNGPDPLVWCSGCLLKFYPWRPSSPGLIGQGFRPNDVTYDDGSTH